ncbi:hypothetical protein SF12_00905 [Streptomyces sp. MBRL 601]|nr:hypothetical protein SF12_00905 [Streptomyces sp. MBRL 601]
MVQIPACSVESTSALASADAMPAAGVGVDVDGVLDHARVRAPVRDPARRDPAQHRPVRVDGGEAVLGQLRSVERLPDGCDGLEVALPSSIPAW